MGSEGSRRPNRVDNCTDTQDNMDGKHITIISKEYTDNSVYECSLSQHVSTHAVLFIDYLGGIALVVHVRTRDMSAS